VALQKAERVPVRAALAFFSPRRSFAEPGFSHKIDI